MSLGIFSSSVSRGTAPAASCLRDGILQVCICLSCNIFMRSSIQKCKSYLTLTAMIIIMNTIAYGGNKDM